MKINSKQQLRIDIITKYIAGEIQREDAALAIGVGERQFRRIMKKFKQKGVISFFHGNIGSSPPNKTSIETSDKIIRLYIQKYKGLNITHFTEKLKMEGLENLPSYSTIKNILYEQGQLQVKPKRKKRVHKPRQRYAKEGLMVQIDGSHHAWFFGKLCCLTAAVDDATGKILGAKFSEEETTLDAMDVVEQILLQYGRFHMLYSDKAGIYGGGKRQGYSNMNKSLSKLDILCVQANSAQAKGRVERLFRTLQDRLVMEMRLNNITTIDEANKYLKEEYIPMFNEKFGVEAIDPIPGYKALDEGINLDEIFCLSETRKVASGNVVSFRGKKLVVVSELNYHIVNRYVDVRVHRNGEIKIYFGEQKLEFEEFHQRRGAA